MVSMDRRDPTPSDGDGLLAREGAQALSDAHLAGAADALPVAVVVLDADGRPVWTNRAVCRIAESPAAREELKAALAAATEPAIAVSAAGGRVDPVVVKVPTDRGLAEHEVRVATAGDHRVLVLHTDADGRLAGTADDELFARVVRELLARVEVMLEHTSDIIAVLDPEGRVRYSNAAAGRLTGLTGGETTGRFALDFVHPDDADALADGFAEVLVEPGRTVRADVRMRFIDGEWHFVEATAENLLHVPAVDGIVVTLHDVTDRVRAEEQVAAREALLRSLIENLTDVVVVLDEHFDVTFITPGIEHIILAPPESHLGQSGLSDIHPDDLPTALAALDEVMSGPLGARAQAEIRLEAMTGSGEWRWLETTAVNRLADPSVNGIVVTLHDVTERKAVEQRLQAAFDRERATADRLRELDELKDDFLATVSHELRTPLAAIVGFADLLARPDLDPAVRDEIVGRLASSASAMRAMVDNVLDFSALEAGKVTLVEAPVELAEAVAVAVRALGSSVAHHVLDVSVPPGVVARADPDGLGHVLRNLVSNAAKYSARGSTIVVEASAGPEGWVRIAVQDEGIGIGPDEAAKVFERFYRGPGASFVGRGSGIGLNIVRRYTELMGGSVSVVSEPGRGSRFEVVLPAAAGEAAGAPAIG